MEYSYQKYFWLKTQKTSNSFHPARLELPILIVTSRLHLFLFYATLTVSLSTVSWNFMFYWTSNHSRAQNMPDCARGFHGQCPQVKFRADLLRNEVTPWLRWHSNLTFTTETFLLSVEWVILNSSSTYIDWDTIYSYRYFEWLIVLSDLFDLALTFPH